MEHATQSPPPALLSTAEVAALHLKSIKTIHRMVRDGRLTPLKQLPGKRGAYLFSPEHVAEVLAGKAKGDAA